MKPLRLLMCAFVLCALSVAVVKMFEALDRSTQPETSLATVKASAAVSVDVAEVSRWLTTEQSATEHWKKLVQLADDPSVPEAFRNEIRGMLARLSRPRLNLLLLGAMADVDANEKEERDTVNEYNQKQDPLKNRFLAIMRTGAEKNAPEEPVEIRGERYALETKLRHLQAVCDIDRQRIRGERNVFNTRVSQLQKLVDSPGYLPAAEIENWNPSLLSVKERLHAPVTFEVVDMPLGDALKLLNELSAAEIVLDPRVTDRKDVRINLNVRDMDVSAATYWISRLSELESAVKGDRIVVAEPGPENPKPVTVTPHLPSTPENPGDF